MRSSDGPTSQVWKSNLRLQCVHVHHAGMLEQRGYQRKRNVSDKKALKLPLSMSFMKVSCQQPNFYFRPPRFSIM